MEMIECKSSQVHSFGYDPATQVLAVKYHSGGIYNYEAVPSRTFEELCGCESVGKFIGTAIKGKHRFTRVPTPTENQQSTQE